MWTVCFSSAVMKADICDKCSDHKLSNHSITCLLAAPLVTLTTLPLPVSSVLLPFSPVHGGRVGQTWSEFTLTGAKVSHRMAGGISSQR